jgi:hypothetical protein
MYLAFGFQKKGDTDTLFENPVRTPKKLREDDIIVVK